jgi:pentatricopeptide repeat protein
MRNTNNAWNEAKLILKRIRASGSTDVHQFNIEMHKLIDERKFNLVLKLWDQLKSEKIYMKMDDYMKMKMIVKLNKFYILPKISFTILNSLSKDENSFHGREKLYCMLIETCGKQRNWRLARDVFDSFEKKTPKIKGALASAYLNADRADLVRPQDLMYEGTKNSRLKYLYDMMKYSMLKKDPENAFMYLEKLKFFIELGVYYHHKTEILYKFQMFDELDEVFYSIQKDASCLTSGNFIYLLMHYNASKDDKDKEKVEFLRMLGSTLVAEK